MWSQCSLGEDPDPDYWGASAVASTVEHENKVRTSGAHSARVGGMTTSLRMPATVATKKGAGFLAEKAAERTVVLTNHGKPTAVVMSPEHFDELERSLRHAADRLVQGVTDLVAERSEFSRVDEVRERLHARR